MTASAIVDLEDEYSIAGECDTKFAIHSQSIDSLFSDS